MCEQTKIEEKAEVLRRLAQGDLLTNGKLVGHTQVFYFISDGREVDPSLTYLLEHRTDDLRRLGFEWRARRVSILKLAGDEPEKADVERVTAYLEGIRDQRMRGYVPPGVSINPNPGQLNAAKTAGVQRYARTVIENLERLLKDLGIRR